MARPESDRLTPSDGDRESGEYDYELIEPVAVGADAKSAGDAEARLTLPGPDSERITVIGVADDLRRRLDQILAWESGDSAAERRERIAEYPMPNLDDLETVPADEFYDDASDR